MRLECCLKVGAKEALLMWCRNHITANFGISVNDFGKSWRDGKAFLAIINCIQEGLARMSNEEWKTNKDRQVNVSFSYKLYSSENGKV